MNSFLDLAHLRLIPGPHTPLDLAETHPWTSHQLIHGPRTDSSLDLTDLWTSHGLIPGPRTPQTHPWTLHRFILGHLCGQHMDSRLDTAYMD